MKPGATQQPRRVDAQRALGRAAAARRRRRGRPRSAGRRARRGRRRGSRMRPPRIRMRLIARPPVAAGQRPRALARRARPPGEQVEHRHAQRDAVAHLVEDHARAVVGEVVRELDAAVHRARVHHDRVVLGEAQLGAVDAEGGAVLARAREVGARRAARSGCAAPSRRRRRRAPRAATCRPSRRAPRCRAGSSSAAPPPAPRRRASRRRRCSSARRGCAGCRRRS